jgi:tetratricopeptide (TPR) repeat protein
VRDPANAGRESAELKQIRSDYAILYEGAIESRLGGVPPDLSAVDAGAARAIERAEKAVVENPWLPLHVAFQVQLEADMARVEAAPSAAAPAPTAPVDQAHLDERRLAMDWMIEAGNLEKSGDYDGAAKLLNRARRTSLGIGDSSGVARAHLALARLARARGLVETARREYDRALVLYRRLGQPDAVVLGQTERGALGPARPAPRS